MFKPNEYPQNLLQQYHQACQKLKKFDKAFFKRFGPNVSEISSEFTTLARKFDEGYLPQYAGLCYLGAAKCLNTIGDKSGEVDILLKGAAAFIKAHERREQISVPGANSPEHLEGAFRCYHQALALLDNDSPMKAAVIRQLKKIHPASEAISEFTSPFHRIFDLETAAKEHIQSGDLCSALDKLTEIYDDIVERKVQGMYPGVLERNETLRLILLLILELPPARQSPSNIVLLEKYAGRPEDEQSAGKLEPFYVQGGLVDDLKFLARSIREKDEEGIKCGIDEVINDDTLSKEDYLLLKRLYDKFFVRKL